MIQLYKKCHSGDLIPNQLGIKMVKKAWMPNGRVFECHLNTRHCVLLRYLNGWSSKKNIAHTKPIEIRTSKSSVLKCFQYSNGWYSDSQCTNKSLARLIFVLVDFCAYISPCDIEQSERPTLPPETLVFVAKLSKHFQLKFYLFDSFLVWNRASWICSEIDTFKLF